ncbi:MAG: MBL fold metallo-hydrolase RNA specificity domain-containing protein [Anaerolineae bacterium]
MEKRYTSIELTFLGAAETVTGSRFLLHVDGRRYLVDCGLFQGGRRLKALNWEPFPLPSQRLDAVLLTHAHIDHSGYLPRLVRQGFRGPVYASEATCALLEIMLPDSAYLQEQDAAYANKKGYSRHKPALPLYTVADAERTLELLHPVPFQQPLTLDGVTATWQPAGHILGSATLEVTANADGGQRLVFSGDLGRYHGEIMKAPTGIAEADVLVVESTYGNRLHAEQSIQDALADALGYVIEQRGVLLIPSFAVGRTQQVLYHIRRLQDQGWMPDPSTALRPFGRAQGRLRSGQGSGQALPVFIDSPMAVEASHIYCRFGDDHNLDVNLLMDERVCPLRCRETHFVRDVEESKTLNTRPGPAVIISASGMCTGGRILHHLKWRLPDARNAVLFVGYQAEGTRGRLLLDGAKRIRIHGQEVPVRARITSVDALSAHADRDELLRWIAQIQPPPQRVFVVHGEGNALVALAEGIRALGVSEVVIPEHGETKKL